MRDERRYRTWSLSHLAVIAHGPSGWSPAAPSDQLRPLAGATATAERFIVKLDHPIRAGPPRAGAGQLRRS